MDSDDNEVGQIPRGRSMTGSNSIVASDAVPDSDEVNQMFTDSALRNVLNEFLDRFFELSYIITQQKDQIANSPFAAYVVVLFDAIFFTLLCFSAQIDWFQEMQTFQEGIDTLFLNPKNIPSSTVYGLFTVVWVFVVLFLGLVGGSVFSLANQMAPAGWALKALRVMLFILIQAGYIPILSILLSPLSCNRADGEVVMIGHPEIDCLSTPHLTYLVLSSLGAILFIPIAGLFALVCFDISPRGGSHLSRSTSRQDFMTFVGRTLCVVIHVVARSGKALAAFLFIASLFSTILWLLFPMYYKPYFNKLRGSLLVLSTWTAFMCAIFSGGSLEETSSGLIAYCIIAPFLTVAGWYFVAWRLNGYNESFLEEVQHSKHRKYRYFFDVELQCRHLFSGEQEMDVASLQCAKTIFQRGMRQFKKSSLVLSQYCIFLMNYDQYSDGGELQMNVYSLIGSKKSWIDEKYLSVCIRRMWQEKMALSTGKGGLDMNDQLFYRRQYAIARYYHMEAKKKLYFFWHSLLRPGITELQIESRAEEFEFFEHRALASYDHLLRRFPNHKELLRSVGTFWMEIHANAALANEYFSIADEIEEAESSKNSKKRFQNLSGDQGPNGSSQIQASGDSDEEGLARNDTGMRFRKGTFKEGARTNTTSTSKDRERLRSIRSRLAKLQGRGPTRESESVLLFNRLLRVLQLVLFGAPLAGFVVFYMYSSSLFRYTSALDQTYNQMTLFHSISYTVRSQIANDLSHPEERELSCTHDIDCINTARNEALQQLEQFGNMTEALYLSGDLEATGLRSFWTKSSIPVRLFSGNPPREVDMKMTYMSLLNEFVSSSEAVLKSEIDQDYLQNANFLFITYNAPTVIFESFLDSLKILMDSEIDGVNTFLMVMVSLVGVMVIIILVILITWQPVYNRVRSEVSALGLLRRLTRPGILEMCRKYQFQAGDKAEDTDAKNEMSLHVNIKSGNSIWKNIFLASTLLATIGCFAYWILGTRASVFTLPDADKAALRVSYASLTEYSTRDLFLLENITSTELSMAESFRENMMQNHHKLVRLAVDEPTEEEWIFSTCVGDQELGIQDFIVFYLDASIEDSFRAQVLSGEDRIEYARHNMSYTPSNSPVMTCMAKVRENSIRKVEADQKKVRQEGIIFFWIVWPFFFYFYAFRIPMAFKEQVRSAAGRSNKILNLVPPRIIETSQKLKEYMIENGLLRMEDFEDFKDLGANEVDEDFINEDELVSVSRRHSFSDQPHPTISIDQANPSSGQAERTTIIRGGQSDSLLVQSSVRFRSGASIITHDEDDLQGDKQTRRKHSKLSAEANALPSQIDSPVLSRASLAKIETPSAAANSDVARVADLSPETVHPQPATRVVTPPTIEAVEQLNKLSQSSLQESKSKTQANPNSNPNVRPRKSSIEPQTMSRHASLNDCHIQELSRESSQMISNVAAGVGLAGAANQIKSKDQGAPPQTRIVKEGSSGQLLMQEIENL